MTYDAVVIGAGPAGSSTAYYLASRGYQVLLLDKQPFPREKPCGDGLTPRALLALKEMGLGRLWNDCRKIDALQIVEHRRGLVQLVPLEGPAGAPTFGGVLPRFDLDQSVCGAAVGAGAQLWTGVTALRVGLDRAGRPSVVCKRESEEPFDISSRFVVIAEGSAGGLGERLRRTPQHRASVGFAVRQYFPGQSDVGSLFEVHIPLTVADQPIPLYGWVFPVSDAVINVGVGTGNGRGSPIDRVSLRNAYTEFLGRLIRSGRITSVEPCSKLWGAPLRFGLIPEETIAPGIVLVGDAAGLVNPLSGEGIAQALESGELAAEAIHDALVNGHADARTYPMKLETRYRRQSHLRDNIRDLYGLARLYDWMPKRGVPHSASTTWFWLKDAIWDLDRPRETTLRALLWKEAPGDPSLQRAMELVEARVFDELARLSPLFGELGYYTRESALMLPGYRAMVILSAAACAGRLDEEALRIAAIAEFRALAVLSHMQVGGPLETDPEGWKATNVAAVLTGDAVIARMGHVLNQCDVRVAKAVSRALVKQSEQWVMLLSSGDRAARDAADTTAAIAEEMAEFVGISMGRDRTIHAAQPAVEAWARHLIGAVQILHDLWIDYRGPSASDATPLYLARKGQLGYHAMTAMQRGVDVRSYVKRFHEDSRDPHVLEDAKRAMIDSGAVESAISEARRRACAAEAMLDRLPAGWRTRSLEVLGENVKTALECALP